MVRFIGEIKKGLKRGGCSIKFCGGGEKSEIRNQLWFCETADLFNSIPCSGKVDRVESAPHLVVVPIFTSLTFRKFQNRVIPAVFFSVSLPSLSLSPLPLDLPNIFGKSMYYTIELKIKINKI